MNSIGEEGAQALAAVLSQTAIHTLNLSKNRIGNGGAVGLATVLSQSSIHTLDLNEN